MPHLTEIISPIIDPPKSPSALPEVFQWLPDRENMIKHIDAFRPWNQWVIQGGSEGKYTITDNFLPPSQRGTAPLIDTPKIPGGYMTATMEARVPASALFSIGRHYIRGTEELGTASYGACGPFSVVDLNRSGHSGSVWEDSPIVRVTNEWRKRMGVISDYEYSRPHIRLNNGQSVIFNVSYDSGVSSSYGAFGSVGLAEIGYGMVMLANYLPKVKLNEGDFFFAQVNMGERGPKRLVAVEVGKQLEKYKAVMCHPIGDGFAKLAKEALAKNHPEIAANIPDVLPLWLAKADAMDVLAYACGWNVARLPESGSEEMKGYERNRDVARAKANELAGEFVAFRIDTPDHRESIKDYYNRK